MYVSVIVVAAVLGATGSLASRPESRRSLPSRKIGLPPTAEFKGGPPSSHTRALAEQERLSRVYHGTHISPMPSATGRALTLQREIAAAFARSDQRKTRFKWLDQSMDSWVVGWRGIIKEMAPVGNGWLVRVRITPELASDHGSVHTNTSRDEVYEYARGQLRFVRSIDVPTAEPRVTIFH